ncbi:MAG: HAD family hydrolase [Candidatus Micrarchaeota archaeon]|nr:HAD family hydrolase [Candidatus Micrarchaeota archaeon]
MIEPKTKLIILDIDGVIVYSKNALNYLYSNLFKEFGYDFDKDLIPLVYGKTDKETYQTFVSLGYDIGSYEDYRNSLSKYKQEADKYYELTPIGNTVQYLSQRYKVCVATNRIRSSAERILNKFGILNFFYYVASATEYEPKPQPDMLLACVQKANVEEKDAMFVGDTKIDELAGKKANIKTILVKFE